MFCRSVRSLSPLLPASPLVLSSRLAQHRLTPFSMCSSPSTITTSSPCRARAASPPSSRPRPRPPSRPSRSPPSLALPSPPGTTRNRRTRRARAGREQRHRGRARRAACRGAHASRQARARARNPLGVRLDDVSDGLLLELDRKAAERGGRLVVVERRGDEVERREGLGGAWGEGCGGWVELGGHFESCAGASSSRGASASESRGERAVGDGRLSAAGRARGACPAEMARPGLVQLSQTQ